ncbi:MAG TPA: hypothetical protein VM913_08890 [Sphingomicrobium sp.]|jgi:hypothetical protein|nr:hypothetical protein [Sphingomicrobium sp.]
MQTVYDWVTIFIFAGLITRFLQQSTVDDGEDASLWHYLLAAAGCGLANWLGNEGHHLAAAAAIAAILFYTAYFIIGMGRHGPRH